MDPYQVLNISPDADDQAIRQAYLAAAREFTPDQSPERFQRIAAAYEKIKDARARSAILISSPKEEFDSLSEVVRSRLTATTVRHSMDPESLKSFLRSLA